MTEDSWEHRMAARAAARWTPDVQRDREWLAGTAQWRAAVTAARAYRSDMTLDEGIALLRAVPWACACIGPPYCCQYAYNQAKALHRAAHVAVRQMADLAGRTDG